jgi:nucleotide-binding universal stress UspA family protein
MARWLHEASAGREELVGIHVPDERLRVGEEAALRDQVSLAIDEALVRTLSGSTSSPIFGHELIAAPSADQGITRGADELECDAILIGRSAHAADHPVPPLGTTARRLLRHLPRPVLIVSADLQRIGSGPIVLATDLGTYSLAAAKLARTLADSLGRRLCLASVDVASDKLEMLAEWLTVSPRRETADVEAWARAHELGVVDVRVRSGELIESLVATARELDAPLIVCGSRCLVETDRVYASSTAADLVRHGDRAVLVVGETLR